MCTMSKLLTATTLVRNSHTERRLRQLEHMIDGYRSIQTPGQLRPSQLTSPTSDPSNSDSSRFGPHQYRFPLIQTLITQTFGQLRPLHNSDPFNSCLPYSDPQLKPPYPFQTLLIQTASIQTSSYSDPSNPDLWTTQTPGQFKPFHLMPSLLRSPLRPTSPFQTPPDSDCLNADFPDSDPPKPGLWTT